MKQKELKQYEQIKSISLDVDGQYNIDTGKHVYDLSDKHVIDVSTGVYGANGALVEFTNNENGEKIQLAVIGRTSELFELL